MQQIKCPHCKKGFFQLETHRFYVDGNKPIEIFDLWVCQYCRFSLHQDNPSSRDFEEMEEGAWDEIMS